MEISEINIEPLAIKNGLVGFVSLVVNNDFKCENIAIYTCPSKPEGLRLVFPTREYQGNQLKTFYPINRAAYEVLAVAVANAYWEIMEKLR